MTYDNRPLRDDSLPAKWIPGPLSLSERHALAYYAARTDADNALEVGHYLGASTSVLLNALPSYTKLVTVDHHWGDEHTPETSPETFRANIEPFIFDRGLHIIDSDMRTALRWIADRDPRKFGFVFYDADHSADGVRDFWQLALPLLAPHCVLLFDDADWEEQSTLTQLAQGDGFVIVREREFVRHPKTDKKDPETYTLEVMERDLR